MVVEAEAKREEERLCLDKLRKEMAMASEELEKNGTKSHRKSSRVLCEEYESGIFMWKTVAAALVMLKASSLGAFLLWKYW